MITRIIVALLFVVGHALSAQSVSPGQSAVLRGTVTNATGEPLQYAVVSIPSLDRQQFANSQGKFYFTGLEPGKYQLSIRQLGFTAVSVEITLAAGQSQDVPVRMQRIVTTLTSMKVLADWPCDKPGRPSGVGRVDLVEVFEQLEQNAVRMRLLSTEYPFDVITERIRVLRHADGLETIESHDSVRAPNQQKARYRPGEVVHVIDENVRPRQKYMQLPTLLDFADPLFQANHCFLLRGVEQTATGKEIRVDFKPAAKLKTPDVAGSVFLDAESYKLLRSDIEMTKIPNDLPGLMRVQALTYFDDIVPGLPTIGE
ncbi:MAG: carboxypeptidase-like regulatory domain-containing protein, partial [Gemmatimonadaceae bacterium]